MEVRDNLNLKNIGIIAINVDDRRHRTIRPDVIERLTESIKSVGLINPITIYPDKKNDTYHLIAGRHRYEAYKRLKIDNIPAIILEGLDALDAEEIELRENVDRGELTQAQQSIHYARLKEIKDEKYALKPGPKPDSGIAPQIEGKLLDDKKANSVTAVAKETNRSAGSIERDVQRVKKIKDISEVVGTSLDAGVELDALARLPEDTQRDLIKRALDGEKVSARAEVKKKEREDKERRLGEKQLALPEAKFGVILADPPWKFKTYSQKGMDRSADNHYPTQDTEEICDLPINLIADKNCVLFLWATVPMLPDALKVMESWGFTYKSHCIWAKDRIGTGYWFRNQHEILLLGVKGLIPSPAAGSQFPSLFVEPVQEHSRKPDAFHRMIELYFPNLPKIELNARRSREGWETWGLEAPEEDEIKVPEFLKREETEIIWEEERETAEDDFPF